MIDTRHRDDVMDAAVELQNSLRERYRDVDLDFQQCVDIVLKLRAEEDRRNSYVNYFNVTDELGPILFAVTGDGRTYRYRAPSEMADPRDSGWLRLRNDDKRIEPPEWDDLI